MIQKKHTNNFLADDYNEISAKKASLNKTKILLAEDDELNRFIVDNILKRQNIELTTVKNGLEAVAVLKTESFDLILMDIQMPKMNGIEATYIIRNELKMQIPIIALTSNTLGYQKDEVMQVGMNGFLTKPFKEIELINLITKHYNHIPEKVNTKLILTKETAKSKLLYNLEKLEELSKGNIDFVKKMCKLFVKITPDYLTQINDFYHQRNISGLKKLIHKMKPSIDYMGINSLKQIIRDLEHLSDDKYALENLKSLVENTISILTEVVLQIRKKELS